jgi:type VI secretion system secreted protein VgrG
MASYKQSGRLMKFSSPLGEDVLLIEALKGSEKISHLYDFQADLLATAGAEIDPKDIIGAKVTVEIALLEVQGTRYVNGLVASFEQVSVGKDFDLYRVQIVPSLWLLRLSYNCRVFQDKTVMDIVKSVISTYGLSMADKTEGTLQPLDYCTQYSESDFNFISRITEQHGIFYWFEHTDGDNKVIFGNSRSPYADCPLVHKVKYYPVTSDREESYVSLLYDFSATSTMVSGQHAHWDYDFRTYKAHQISPQTSASPYGKNAFEIFTYPGGEEGYVKDTDKVLTSPNHATGFLTAQTGVTDSGSEIYHGDSSARSFCSGYTFQVTDHPREAWNRTYLLTEVFHQVDQWPPYRSEENSRTSYTNRFTAITSDILYRPPAITPRPRIYGPQTALVVAPAGDDLHLDKYGRVCVQFFWDRERKPNTPDSTWLRVAQPWAGNGWGTFFWPRANDEVIVQFINGDPDNPIVIGSVYNGTNMPKYALPEYSTRTGIVTRSSKGGTAATSNELRFEDKMGSEQIYLHAEKDMDHTIENDLRVTIGGKESVIIGASRLEKIGSNAEINIGSNRTENVGGNEEITIGGNRTESVGSSLSLNVNQSHNHQVGMNYGLSAGQNVSISGGISVVIEAGAEGLTLSGPGGFINIGPAGVAISGTLVLINSGGAPGVASPVQTTNPGSPQAPDQADDGTKGTKM